METDFVDEIDCGNFFDQIDDLIEFPPENECEGGGGGNSVSSDDYKDYPGVWNVALPECDTLFSGSHNNAASDLSAELSVPYEDIVQLEWLSTFMEDSFSGGGMTLGKENLCANEEPSPNQFQTSSPISVLESSSSSCSGEKIRPPRSSHLGPQRARSKRPRPATFSPRAAIQLISSPSSYLVEPPQPFVAPGFSAESEIFAELPAMKMNHKPAEAELQKKKKTKITLVMDEEGTHQNPPAQAVRKCMHCQITKTPQWRAGPMGPKTLCNACGVRYKSGRLFPEYRPAASPTFVPSMHSNSHKKVLEMRSKVAPGTTATTPTTTKSEFIPNLY